MAEKPTEKPVTKTVPCRVVQGNITHGHYEVLDENGNRTGLFQARRTQEGEICELSEAEARRMGAYLSEGDLFDDHGRPNGLFKTVDLVR